MQTRTRLAQIRNFTFAFGGILTLCVSSAIGLAQEPRTSFGLASAQVFSTLNADTPAILVDSFDQSVECEPRWETDLFCLPGIDGQVAAAVTWDDGTGEALYVGGWFLIAGCTRVDFIARWDGSSWTPLSSGLNAPVEALMVFDDGSGPALYAGGVFNIAGGISANHIARWDGSTWSSLGSGVNNTVSALTVFDDGFGPALYAGGDFLIAGGHSASRIARWDGVIWSPLESGMDNPVSTLAVYDDGSGPALYAGGTFTMAGGNSASQIARWDGIAWSSLGSGMGHNVFSYTEVSAFAVFDDGSGPALYAGGNFNIAGGQAANRIARWDGQEWSALGSGISGASVPQVHALTVFNDGSGPALYAGGIFSTAGGQAASQIARWDGSSWSQLGTGISNRVYALAAFDDGGGSGPSLYAAGNFSLAGEEFAKNIARWNGSVWSELGSGLNGSVEAVTIFDDGNGPALYAGGYFDFAGGQSVNRIARWDGQVWSPLGSGLSGTSNPHVRAISVFDDGTGPALYAAGVFTSAGGQPASRIARWNGSSWLPLGTGISGSSAEVLALAVFDDGSGPALYAGGTFTIAGDKEATHIARWDGSTWTTVGSGMTGTVFTLAVFDDGRGAGPALYAGGSFRTAGGQAANRIARWDGSAWSPLGPGMSRSVFALTVLDDGTGTGPSLYAGGNFRPELGQTFDRIARWDGLAWSPLGPGLSNDVHALAVFDDGSGPALYAGGAFTTSGSQSVIHIARWDGHHWSPLGSGLSGPTSAAEVRALTVFDSGFGPALFAGGSFIYADLQVSSYLAKWQGCPTAPICPPDLSNGGGLNFFDIAAFLSLYQTQDSIADWNGDGLINFFDLVMYLYEFNVGCP